MEQNVKQTLFSLKDAQIAVRQPLLATTGPSVTTQLRGGVCNTQSQCAEAGGKWTWDPYAGMYYCIGSDCSDSGTGDWD
jgi:hypothetical protein